MSDTMRDAPRAVTADEDYILRRAALRSSKIIDKGRLQPPPPALQTVQEIMRLMSPYISACVDAGVNNVTGRTSLQFEADVAKVEAAFKPLQAALTALVEKNHELQFSLDGVNAMRRLSPKDGGQFISPNWGHVYAAFVDGAREARANLSADDADFKRAADGYSKRVFEEVDPESERRLREGDWSINSTGPDEPITERESVWLTLREELNPHTVNLVVRFARALAKKLAAAEKKYGYSDGWRSPDWMDECRAQLLAHVAKGDPRDVAAYCAFLWFHNESTATPGIEPQQGVVKS